MKLIGSLRPAKSYESVAERKAKQSAALPELVVDGFLPEQIWAAMELHNGPLLKRLQPRVKRIAEEGKALAEEADKEGGSDEEDDDSELASEDAGSVEGSEAEAEIEDDGESGSEGEEDEDLDEEQGDDDEEGLESGSETEEPKRRSSNRDTSAVDDEFFRLEDMERFAEQFEEKDMKRADGADDKPDFDLGMDPDEMSDGDDDEEDDEEDDRGKFENCGMSYIYSDLASRQYRRHVRRLFRSGARPTTLARFKRSTRRTICSGETVQKGKDGAFRRRGRGRRLLQRPGRRSAGAPFQGGARTSG